MQRIALDQPTPSPSVTYLNYDGTLRIVKWAKPGGSGAFGVQDLLVSLAARPIRMAHSPATGQALLSNGQLGVDVIRLAAGEAFTPHTHPGDHLLIVIGGVGTITYDGRIYETHAGEAFLIEGNVPHAVGAITHHVILAIGSPHRAIDDPDRMSLTPYRAIAAELGDVTCLICNKTAVYPVMLHTAGCQHCPCTDCHPDGQPLSMIDRPR